MAVLSEAVWRVTIVDATLIRYYPAAYDAALIREPGARAAEDTLAGLRYVRNLTGRRPEQSVVTAPSAGAAAPAAGGPLVTQWRWRPLPEPDLAALPPAGRDWEASRHRAYQARLAGQPAGQASAAAAAFLDAVSAGLPGGQRPGRAPAARP
jgi:hypothetical protein